MKRNLIAIGWLLAGLGVYLWLTWIIAVAIADAHPPHLIPEDGVLTQELLVERSSWLRLLELEKTNGPYVEEVIVKDRPPNRGDVASPPPAPTDIRVLVEAYFPAAWVDEALAVIECESRFNPVAKNPHSTASGLFQFLNSTWDRWGVGSVFDAKANVQAAALMVQHYEDQGWSRWAGWSCQP